MEAASAGPIPLLFLVTNFDRGGAEKILARWPSGSRVEVRCAGGRPAGTSQVIAGDFAAQVCRSTTSACARGGTSAGAPPVRAAPAAGARSKFYLRFCFTPTLIGGSWVQPAACRYGSRPSGSWRMGGPVRRLLNRGPFPWQRMWWRSRSGWRDTRSVSSVSGRTG